MLLAVAASNAHAEWTVVPATGPVVDDTPSTLSIDRDTVVTNGREVTVRVLVDLSDPHLTADGHEAFRSVIGDKILRCEEHSVAIGRTTSFEKHHAQGDVVGMSDAPASLRFDAVLPGSTDEALERLLCPKTKPGF
ncbi:hypothetical protein F6X40_23890 [Paraburkholderia sp. UCT31]|uniref:surface-adhesin E family protein n=1 Tax=Paraburkholderia sp. UCT31 TaxID=2615209 RepID=UPI001654D055|nr:surface-adhesin E family protein [Paraburkholderia sp. UCT31]MBC8739758.1 hypothetical protein [Paraburkholderia sp. UCT31]